MCFSPEADALAGIVVVVIGLDAVAHARHYPNRYVLASIPLLLGVHQLIEVGVWWWLQGEVSEGVGRAALRLYLLIAMILPLLIPLGFTIIEPPGVRRRRMACFAVLGSVVTLDLVWSVVAKAIDAAIRPWHLTYVIHVSHPVVLGTLYVVAICGSLLFSGYARIVRLGIANLIVVVTLTVFTVDGLASLWCIYAAISTAAIAAHLRITNRDHLLASA